MRERSVQRRRRTLAFVALAVAAVLPRRGLAQLPTVCPVRLLTGYPCPTCGMTRSWHSLLRIDPGRAVRDHPFGPLLMGAVAVGALSPGSAAVVPAQAAQLPAGVKVLALGAWLGWWVLRLVATWRLRRRSR